jgi:hypothetical protein
MRRTKPNFENLELADLLKIAALAMLLSACFPAGSIAQHRGQKTFSSPEEANNAFVAAAQNNDEKALLEILGPEGREIVSSGDATEDAEGREICEQVSGDAPPLERT